MARSKKRARGEKQDAFPLKNILIGAAAGTALFMLMLLAACAVILKADVSAGLYSVIGLAAGALSALAGGFTAVRPLRRNGIPFGALTGIIQAIAVSVVIFAANSASAGTKLFLLMGLTVLFAVAGGIAAVNLKKRRKV